MLLLTVELNRKAIEETVGGIDLLTIGANRQGGTLTLGTSETTIAISSGIVNAGLCYVCNHSDAAYVDIGYATGVYPNRAYSGEAGLIPLAPGTSMLYVRASSGGTKLAYEITERS